MKLSKKTNLLHFITVFISIALIVLHPYTIYGKPGIIIAFIFVLYALLNGIKKYFFWNMIVPILILLAIANIGVISSIANNIPQVNHPATVISLLIMVLAANGIFLYCKKNNISIDDLLFLIFLVIVLNSVIILLELQFPLLRSLIEGYLDPFSGGVINYEKGYRLRGIASAGGAGLSISIPAAVIIALHLFYNGKLTAVFLITSFFILVASVLVIGRTGLVLLIIPIGMYLLMLLISRNTNNQILKMLFLIFVPVGILGPLLFQFVHDFLEKMFGDSFVLYAFGFILDGHEGIQNEGTVGVIAEFLTVLPIEFPQTVIGYGFYGGSEFEPWTDSGFNRTFLSVGFIFGSIFYLLLYYVYFCAFKISKYLVGSFILILTIAELKEPLLYSGFASRMFILIFVYYYCENKTTEVKHFRFHQFP